MWWIIGSVILVAWFFGISYSAALHGMLWFLFWVIVIGIGITLLAPLFEPVEPENKKIKQVKPKKDPKTIKFPTWLKGLLKWALIFSIGYFITLMALGALGISEQLIANNSALWLQFSLPSIPFAIYLLARIVKKYLKTKKRTNPNH